MKRSCALILWLVAAASAAGEPPISFTEVTAAAGFDYQHGISGLSPGVAPELSEMARAISGGVAAGDYDGDSWVDLYAVRGDAGPNLLFRNRGDGTFEEVGAAAGVAIDGEIGSGPAFGDADGDGRLDLFIGGVDAMPRLFRNLGAGGFVEIAAPDEHRDTFSAAWADLDRDGDLDLALAHWEHRFSGGCSAPCNGHLWRNDGGGVLSEADLTAGITGFEQDDHTFTPNFADVDNDGWPDLLYASDWNTSRVYSNQGDGTFVDVSDPEVMTDDNGMGAALGDYDNDGDLDWFVTSIHDPIERGGAGRGPGRTGNRLYRNLGDGTFEEVSAAAGVRMGHWGWAACFADFDNDRHLDIFHVNGWFYNPAGGDVWITDPSPLFMSDGDGTFTERAAEVGLADTGLGRGVVCFDYDRDGDLDLFTANHSGPPALYRNDGGNASSFLGVRLRGGGANVHAVGARVYATAGGVTQMREIRMGSNFQSQQPLEVHFGLGDAPAADIEVRWPSGQTEPCGRFAANRFLEFSPGCGNLFADGFESGDLGAWSGP